jgi:hypothetical protein
MSISPDNIDHFSYLRGCKIHSLFSIKKKISKLTIKGFAASTYAINRELEKMQIPLILDFFVLDNIDGDGEPLDSQTLYVTHNVNIDGGLISLLYLEHAHRMLGKLLHKQKE